MILIVEEDDKHQIMVMKDRIQMSNVITARDMSAYLDFVDLDQMMRTEAIRPLCMRVIVMENMVILFSWHVKMKRWCMMKFVVLTVVVKITTGNKQACSCLDE